MENGEKVGGGARTLEDVVEEKELEDYEPKDILDGGEGESNGLIGGELSLPIRGG